MEEGIFDLLLSPSHWGFEIVSGAIIFGLGVLAARVPILRHLHRDLRHAGHGHDPHEPHPVGHCEVQHPTSRATCLLDKGHQGWHYARKGDLDWGWPDLP